MNRLLKFMIAACAAFVATLASANASAGDLAFVWADNPTAGSYTPNASYSFNSKGGAITVTRGGAGSYSVKIASFDGRTPRNGAAAHVVSYNGAHRCNITSWTGDATSQTINVFCYNGNTRADGRFVVVYYDETTRGGLIGAHLYGLRTWNSAGGTNTSRRVATGSYEVTLGKMGSYAGMGAVLATSMHTTSTYCKSYGWAKSNGNMVVKVLCFDGTGRAADSPFAISYFANPYLGTGTTKRHAAYALATQPAATTAYRTDSSFSVTTASQPITSTKTGTGSYSVQLGGLPSNNKTAGLVLAYGTDNVQCNTTGWLGTATSTTMRVACRNGAGALTDSKFGVLYLTNRPVETVDLAASAINFRLISKTSATRGTVEIEGVIKNVGTKTFTSGANQSMAYLRQAPLGTTATTLLNQLSITSLAPGAVISVKKQIAWDTSVEFPPNFRLDLAWDPDIASDSNPDNDDSNRSNDSKTRSGSDINALF